MIDVAAPGAVAAPTSVLRSEAAVATLVSAAVSVTCTFPPLTVASSVVSAEVTAPPATWTLRPPSAGFSVSGATAPAVSAAGASTGSASLMGSLDAAQAATQLEEPRSPSRPGGWRRVETRPRRASVRHHGHGDVGEAGASGEGAGDAVEDHGRPADEDVARGRGDGRPLGPSEDGRG